MALHKDLLPPSESTHTHKKKEKKKQDWNGNCTTEIWSPNISRHTHFLFHRLVYKWLVWRLFDVTLPLGRWEADVTLPAEEWMACAIKIHEENWGKGEDWPGEKQQHGCYSFLYVPLVNRGLELPSEAHWDVFSPLYQELGQKCCVMCGFLGFLSAPREITVLYPSLADWSESPPYSALPRPGVEPLENKRTALFMRFSCCPYPQTVTWTRGISFNEKYQHWLLWREGGPARMTMLNEITLSSTEDVS